MLHHTVHLKVYNITVLVLAAVDSIFPNAKTQDTHASMFPRFSVCYFLSAQHLYICFVVYTADGILFVLLPTLT